MMTAAEDFIDSQQKNKKRPRSGISAIAVGAVSSASPPVKALLLSVLTAAAIFALTLQCRILIDAVHLHAAASILHLLPRSSHGTQDQIGQKTNDKAFLGGGGVSFLTDPSASFGGCLMIMDDNHFLAEWLAYHWFVLPLRHLVVYIDQKSRTSPIPIFERYKDYITFEVVNWSYPDAYSVPPNFLKGSIHADPINRKLIGEQLKFYEDCMRWYKRHDWTSWITLHDSDEFISVNPQARQPRSKLYLPDVPEISHEGSVMKWLKMTMGHRAFLNGTHTPCIGVPRLQFCTEEDEPTSKYSWSLGHNDSEFLTLRWSTFPPGKKGTRAPKDMVYIGGIDSQYFETNDMLKNGARPHDVIPDKCEWHQRREGSPFQIYHFSGTPEQREFRADPRGKFGSVS